MYVPLGTTVVAFAALFANKSSEITGMPGAKAGVSAPQRSPPCLYYIYIYLHPTRTSCQIKIMADPPLEANSNP